MIIFVGMKRFLLIILSFIFLFSASDVHAQFWKKKDKRKNETHRPIEKKVGKEQPKPETPKKEKKRKEEPQYIARERKDVYRIDLLLPLNLNKQVINGKPVASRSLDPGTEFYKGALIAADSMAKNNFRLELYVHDITDANENVSSLIKNNKLQNTDLIIGMLQSPDIPAVAGYAKSMQVNFLSALSPSDAGIKDNPYFMLLQPTLETHVDKILDYSDKRFSKSSKFLIYRDSSYADDAFNMVKAAFRKNKDFTLVKYNDALNLESYKSQFSTSETNVIYCTILDAKVAYVLLKKLAALGSDYRFEVFGMPTWKAIGDLNAANAYPNVNIYYTTPFLYDDNSGAGILFANKYKEYGSPNPTEFAYRGYEVMYWMTNMLERYGAVFNNNLSDISSLLFTRYNIKPEWDDDNSFLYLENEALHILKFENGNMQEVN